MSKLQMPKAWLTAGVKKSKRVQAKVNMSVEVAGAGLCPVTGKPMERMYANGHEVYCSMDERVVLPIKDTE